MISGLKTWQSYHAMFASCERQDFREIANAGLSEGQLLTFF
jgi:hypothetical protein